MGYFASIHSLGFGVLDREGKPAFPVIHSIIGATLILFIDDRLRKTPNLPLQIFRNARRMHADMMMMNLRDHARS